MLTGFTWCIPLKTKTAEEVSKAYLDHIYSNFGGSVKIMMDNGTLALNEPLYIVEPQYTTNFEQFQLQNLVSSTPRQRKYFKPQNSNLT